MLIFGWANLQMALGNHSDQELLALLEQGSEAAFAEVYERFRPQVRRFAMRVAKSNEAADEIVQNVLLKLWNQRDRVSAIKNIHGWLNRVTTNEALDFLKKVAREKALAGQVWMHMQSEPAYAENDYVLKDYLKLIADVVQLLPAQQQKIYRLSREQYLTYEQIAEELDISPNTVRNHMAAALDNIRKHMSKHAALHTIPPVVACLLFSGRL